MRRPAILIVAALYVLHQDFWFWRDPRPLVFGVLPIGLFYHVAYTVIVSLVLWGLITFLWPAHLDEGDPPREPSPSRESTLEARVLTRAGVGPREP